MKELQTAKQAAYEAGQLIRSYYQKIYQTSYKEGYKDGRDTKINPVTEVDLKSNEKIREILTCAFPEHGWLSEETKDSEARFQKTKVWIIDPLDGTKEFITGIPEFTVSIGLAEEGIPVLGAVYNPITEELFWASREEGAFCNNQRLRCSRQEQLSGIRLITSRSEHQKGKTAAFKPIASEIIPLGSSAYKLGVLAQARGDLYISQHPLSEWDMCAGHLILREAGGILLDLNGNEIKYNQKGVGTGVGIIAGNEILVKKMLQNLPIRANQE
jgi:myo-inositol-1(or 4)-monophosphatase